MALEMSEKMEAYVQEREAQKMAVISFAKMLSEGRKIEGLALEVMCRRVKEIAEQVRKGNVDSTNEEFLEALEECGEKTFVFDAHKFSSNYGKTIYTYNGDVGKELKEFDKQIEELETKKKAAIAAAKVLKKNVKTKSEPPVGAKYKVSQVAPKKKPAK